MFIYSKNIDLSNLTLARKASESIQIDGLGQGLL